MAENRSRELLAKTDKSVKTAESWWSAIKALWQDGKEAIAVFAVGWSVISTALESVLKGFATYGWAGIVLAAVAGLIVACVAAIALIGAGHALIGFQERRMKKSDGFTNGSVPSSALVTNISLEDINRVLGESVHATNNNFEHVYTELNKIFSFGKRLEIVEIELRKSLGAPHRPQEETKELDDLDAAIQKITGDVRSISVKLAEMSDHLQADFQALEGRTVQVFRAKQVEARMDSLLAQIETLSDALSAPTYRQSEDVDFGKWREDYRSWRRLTVELANTVVPYFQMEPRLNTIDPDQLKDDGWTFRKDYFPDTGLMHDYKMFRLVLNNLEILKLPMIVAVRRESIV